MRLRKFRAQSKLTNLVYLVHTYQNSVKHREFLKSESYRYIYFIFALSFSLSRLDQELVEYFCRGLFLCLV